MGTAGGGNPFQKLIEDCHDNPRLLSAAYETHRTKRNAQQRAILLSADGPGITVDPILKALEEHRLETGDSDMENVDIDTRECITFWIRPTEGAKDLIEVIQEKLKIRAPNLWFTSRKDLHITLLEVISATTPEVLTTLISTLEPHLPQLLSYITNHRTRLLRPLLSYDTSAVSLCFLPDPSQEYTYHHLRRDYYHEVCSSSGIAPVSRYVVSSAHVTLARFISHADHDSPEKMKAWLDLLEEVNGWLEREWGEGIFGWDVGRENPIVCRGGRLWYGGGQDLRMAEGW